ncbi:hypothetical protein [Actinotignum urinale]|uniref:hypothetical protein n=1 Tax=Actinotignum urinale TaxID=190146 RepID=UPI00041A8936
MLELHDAVENALIRESQYISRKLHSISPREARLTFTQEDALRKSDERKGFLSRVILRQRKYGKHMSLHPRKIKNCAEWYMFSGHPSS